MVVLSEAGKEVMSVNPGLTLSSRVRPRIFSRKFCSGEAAWTRESIVFPTRPCQKLGGN
jgi:hypothetical protein